MAVVGVVEETEGEDRRQQAQYGEAHTRGSEVVGKEGGEE